MDDTSQVLLFIKSVDTLDRDKVGLLLETDEGLTGDWAMVERVCSRFDKRHDCSDEGPSATGPVAGRKLEEPVPTRTEET